jgi:hypothetical protein
MEADLVYFVLLVEGMDIKVIWEVEWIFLTASARILDLADHYGFDKANTELL